MYKKVVRFLVGLFIILYMGTEVGLYASSAQEQAPSRAWAPGKGSGIFFLGFPTPYFIAEAHGGRLWATANEKEITPKKETAPKKEKHSQKGKDGGPQGTALTKSDCGKLGGEVVRDDRCGKGGYTCYLKATEKSLCIDQSK